MDELKLEEQIGELLRHKGLSIATAESCTVGSICAQIGRVAGASDYLQGRATRCPPITHREASCSQ